jgi:putative hemolysin
MEFGRPCVARDHRISIVVQLLWRGVAFYARALNTRYLLGCCSLGTTDPRLGASLHSQLSAAYLAPCPFRTEPLPGCSCPLDELAPSIVEVPQLFAAYLELGATICSPPAIDHQFGTIDFLTVLDLQNLSSSVERSYLNSLPNLTRALTGKV